MTRCLTTELEVLAQSQGAPLQNNILDDPKGLTCLENTELHLQRDVQHKPGILSLNVINLH